MKKNASSRTQVMIYIYILFFIYINPRDTPCIKFGSISYYNNIALMTKHYYKLLYYTNANRQIIN